jgi:hypothetical protein
MFTREHVNDVIHSAALIERKELIPIYKLNAHDRSLTTDFYTAKNGAEVMVETSHGFDALWNLNSLVLGGRYSREAHTGNAFFNFSFS